MSIKVERGEKRTCNNKTFCDAENWRGSLHAGVLSYITEYTGLRETGIPQLAKQHEAAPLKVPGLRALMSVTGIVITCPVLLVCSGDMR